MGQRYRTCGVDRVLEEALDRLDVVAVGRVAKAGERIAYLLFKSGRYP